ncbi:UNVERIFIED_CONTAM: hypothetical protein K2H54_054809 [Gekko kuhli]
MTDINHILKSSQTLTDAKKTSGPEGKSIPVSKSVDSVIQADESYRMDHAEMGLCVLVNNKNFHPATGMAYRSGTDADAARIIETFRTLGYTVKPYNDLTCKQMLDVLQNVSKDDHSKENCLACVLLSHGDDGLIYGTDGPLELKMLTSLFRGDRLVGEPSLILELKQTVARMKTSVRKYLWKQISYMHIPLLLATILGETHQMVPGLYSLCVGC